MQGLIGWAYGSHTSRINWMEETQAVVPEGMPEMTVHVIRCTENGFVRNIQQSRLPGLRLRQIKKFSSFRFGMPVFKNDYEGKV